MIFMKPVPFEEALASRQVQTLLPTTASSREMMQVSASIRERAVFSARVNNLKMLEVIDASVNRVLSPETVIDPETGERRPARPGESMDNATFRLQFTEVLNSLGMRPDPKHRGTLRDIFSTIRQDLILDTNVKMAQGFGHWQQGQKQPILDLWPAHELFRAELRDDERDWPTRWRGAGGRLFAGGRMIAPKNSPIWTEISAFGLPYAPFDFNSGMDVRDVARREAVALGVIKEAQRIVPESRDFNADLAVSAPERQTALFQTLLRDLGDKAQIVDGSLRFKK